MINVFCGRLFIGKFTKRPETGSTKDSFHFFFGVCVIAFANPYTPSIKLTLYLWIDLHLFRTIQETSPLTSICLSLDGRFALVNLQTTQELHLWDLENKILAHKYVGHTHMRYVIRSCFGGINERFVVSGSEGTLSFFMFGWTGSNEGECIVLGNLYSRFDAGSKAEL